MSQPISIDLDRNDPFLDAGAFAELDVQLRGNVGAVGKATGLAAMTDGCSDCTHSCSDCHSPEEIGIPAF